MTWATDLSVGKTILGMTSGVLAKGTDRSLWHSMIEGLFFLHGWLEGIEESPLMIADSRNSGIGSKMPVVCRMMRLRSGVT
jgi:hypothetical protein